MHTRWKAWGSITLLLTSCGHGAVRQRDTLHHSHPMDDGVRTKGGDSATLRIRVLIAKGEYAQAEVLIAEAVAAGLLARAQGELLAHGLHHLLPMLR